jgi:uncharacterized cupredoxin-like copper-binding protein
MRTRWIVLGVVAVSLLALTSPGVVPAQANGDEQEITIVLGDPAKGEFTFSPDRIELKNGVETKLIIKNAGHVKHELMSVFLSSAWAKVLLEVNGVETEIAFAELELEPGQQAEIIVIPQVPDHVLDEKGGKAEFEFGCFIKDHYKAGMKGTFVVEGESH